MSFIENIMLKVKKLFADRKIATNVLRYSSIRATDRNVPYESSIHKKSDEIQLKGKVPESADVVVIGGGSIGCSTIYHLAKANLGKVVLLEKNRITSGTTWHTAGILWSFRPLESETLMQLQTRDLISNILPEENGEDAGWIKTGTINTFKSKAQMQDGTQNSTFAKSLGIEIQSLKPNEINDIHPLINTKDVYGAIYSPGDGTIDPATYCMSYIRAASKRGAQVIENCSVTNVVTADDYMGLKRVVAVETDMGVIKTNNVINCAGCWAPYVAEMADVRLPQLNFKHAYVVTKGIKGILNTPMVKDHGTVYMKPQGDALQFGGYEMNPIPILDIPKDFSFGLYDMDWDIFDGHTEAAINRIPAISDVGIRSTVCGPESFTADGHPNIGESPEVRGFFVGSAFNSGGMMMGGGAGRQLAHWVEHGKPEFDLFNCDIRRYPTVLTNYNKWLTEKCHEKFAKRYSSVYAHDQSYAGRNQRFSPLHEKHRQNGAVFGARYGFERPVYYIKDHPKPTELDVLSYDYYGQYDHPGHRENKYGDVILNDCTYNFPDSHRIIKNESLTCRTNVVLVDSSFMTKLVISGKDADAVVKRLFSRDLTKSDRFMYCLMLNEGGGIEADVIGNKMKDEEGDDMYFITASSSSALYLIKYIQHYMAKNKLDSTLMDMTDRYCMLSVQGPKSLEVMRSSTDMVDLKYGEWKNFEIAGHKVVITRLSFFGELGYEINCLEEYSNDVYDVIMGHVTKQGGCLAGSRAMASLSTETGFHHWGHTIKSDDNPIEARLLQFCDSNSSFIGSEALEKLKSKPLNKKLAFFTVNCDVPLYGHETIWRNNEIVGNLGIGDYGHALDCNIGYGYVKNEDVTDDWILEGNYEIERMNKRYPAKVYIASPFDPMFKRRKGIYSNKEKKILLNMMA